MADLNYFLIVYVIVIVYDARRNLRESILKIVHLLFLSYVLPFPTPPKERERNPPGFQIV